MLRKTAVIALALSCMLAACGGSGSTDGTSGGDNTTSVTRLVTGTIGTPAAAMSLSLPPPKAAVADRCAAIDPAICRVIATASDGATVMDEDLSDCAFSLALAVGKSYVISFVSPDPATDLCTKFVATLLAGGDSVLSIDAGDDIAFGAITIDPVTGQATFTGSIEEFLACEELLQSDMDDDGICDNFEQAVADDLAGDDGTDDGTDDGATYDQSDLAGTYVISDIVDSASCDDTNDAMAFAYSIVVTANGENLQLEDANQNPYAFNNREDLAPTASVPFANAEALFTATGILLDNGCPDMGQTTNTFEFDAAASPVSLSRTITSVDTNSGPPNYADSVGCVAVYEKQ